MNKILFVTFHSFQSAHKAHDLKQQILGIVQSISDFLLSSQHRFEDYSNLIEPKRELPLGVLVHGPNLSLKNHFKANLETTKETQRC